MPEERILKILVCAPPPHVMELFFAEAQTALRKIQTNLPDNLFIEVRGHKAEARRLESRAEFLPKRVVMVGTLSLSDEDAYCSL